MVYIVLCLTINILHYVFMISQHFKVLNMITVYKMKDEILLNFVSIYLIL